MKKKLLWVLVVALLAGQPSCKTPSAVQAEEISEKPATSDFILTVRIIGGSENLSKLINALTASASISDLHVVSNNDLWFTASRELSIRYYALTNKGIDKIRKDLLKCDGISGLSIVRL